MSIPSKFELTNNEKYLLSIITTMMCRLKQKGLLSEEDKDEIINKSQRIYITNLLDKHEDFGV